MKRVKNDVGGRQQPGTLPTLRGGLIGFGAVAEKGHLPEWLRTPGVEIISVAEPDEARRNAAREILPHARLFASADELFAELQLDFVDICVPSSQHASFVKLALKSGCHVLCEKPLACRVEEVEELLALSAQSSLAVFTVHNWLHAPSIEHVQKMLSEDAIGPVHKCEWSTIRTQPAGAAGSAGQVDGTGRHVDGTGRHVDGTGRHVAGSWRANSPEEGGGLLFDHGWHSFYVIASWIGARPHSISARRSSPEEGHVGCETWDLQLVFPHAEAEIHLTWAGKKRANHATLEGSDGVIRMLDDTVILERGNSSATYPTGNVPAHADTVLTHADSVRAHVGTVRAHTGSAVSNGSYHPDWFGGVIHDFRLALSDSHALQSNQAHALLCARLIDAARRSDESGGEFVSL